MKKLFLGVVIALILISTGYFAYGLFISSQTQGELENGSDTTNVQTCISTKESICQLDGEIAESDYPDSCFENEENILENPYECSS